MRPPLAAASDEPATHFAARNADGSIAGRRNRLASFEFPAAIVRFFPVSGPRDQCGSRFSQRNQLRLRQWA
jgi:hypothetical protein